MSCKTFFALAWLSVLAVSTASAAEVSATVNDIEIIKPSPSNDKEAPANASCVTRCNAAESKCSSEVRRARQECSRNAANGGRDPFAMRDSDYTYFCSYFNGPGRCGSGAHARGCQDRLVRRYGLCVDRMRDNIASMRYDCHLNERDAQNFCREELRECRAACQ